MLRLLNMKISIVIPVYNEEKTILRLLDKVDKLDLHIEKEIIIVDDYSTDDTRNILKKLESKYKIYYHEVNKGKGAAVRTGLEKSTGDILTIQDADMEYEPNDLKLLLEKINRGYDVVYGSRFMDSYNRYWDNPLHYIGNRGLSFITSILYFQKITDMETCYKVFKREVYEKLNLKAKRFDLEPEITAKIIKAGYKIKEVSINYYPRGFEDGKKITWKDGIMALYYLIKYRFVN